MTTQEAFEEVLEERGLLIRIGYTNQQAKSYRHYYKQGTISKDKIEEILKRAGYEQVIAPVWFNFEKMKAAGEKLPAGITAEYLDSMEQKIETMRQALAGLRTAYLVSRGKRPGSKK